MKGRVCTVRVLLSSDNQQQLKIHKKITTLILTFLKIKLQPYIIHLGQHDLTKLLSCSQFKLNLNLFHCIFLHNCICSPSRSRCRAANYLKSTMLHLLCLLSLCKINSPVAFGSVPSCSAHTAKNPIQKVWRALMYVNGLNIFHSCIQQSSCLTSQSDSYGFCQQLENFCEVLKPNSQ